jgi:hypothetical protein
MSEKTKFIFKLLTVILAGILLIGFMTNVVSSVIKNAHQIELNRVQTENYREMMKE